MKRRVVFAGDSITHGGPWQYWLQEHYVTNFAFPGHTTSDMDMLVDEIVESQPELLIVMIGTNDFGKYRYSEEKVIQNILNVAKKLKANLTQIPVIWHSLTPRSDEFSQSVIEVNAKIRPELESLGFIYHDVFSLLKNNEQNILELEYCEDPDTFGLHLNNLGYEKWFESLGPLIQFELSKSEVKS
jgi:lysophospholipase L1-like esterase